MHVAEMRIGHVLESRPPVAVPDVAPIADHGLVVEELFGHAVLDWNRLALSHPDEDHAFEDHRRIDAGLHLARHRRLGPFADGRDAVAVLVEREAVIEAGEKATEGAAAFGQHGAAVWASVGHSRHLATFTAEETQVLAEHFQVDGLAPADAPILSGRIPVFR